MGGLPSATGDTVKIKNGKFSAKLRLGFPGSHKKAGYDLVTGKFHANDTVTGKVSSHFTDNKTDVCKQTTRSYTAVGAKAVG